MLSPRVRVKTPENITLLIEHAGFGSRAMAFFLDYLISFLIKIIVFFFLLSGFNLSFISDKDVGKGVMILLFFVINFVVDWFYFTLFEYFANGRSPGKMALNLRVVTDAGTPVSFGQAFNRNLLRIIDSLPGIGVLGTYSTGILVYFFSGRYKRIGDFVAGTVVISENIPNLNYRKHVLDSIQTENQALKQRIFPPSSPAFREVDTEFRETLEYFFLREKMLPQATVEGLAAGITSFLEKKYGLKVPEGRKRQALLELYSGHPG